MVLALLCGLLAGQARAEYPCELRKEDFKYAGLTDAAQAEIKTAIEKLVTDLVKNADLRRIRSVAVMDAKGPCSAVTGFSIYVTNLIRMALTSTGRIKQHIVERRNLYRLNAIIRNQQSIFIDQSTRVKLGRQIAEQAVLIPEITRRGESYEISCRLDSLENAVTLSQERVQVREWPFIVQEIIRKPRASLTVKLDPFVPGATVTVDRQTREAKRTGVSFEELPLGVHTLDVVADCYENYSLDFYLPGNLVLPPVDLMPKKYQLTILVRKDPKQQVNLKIKDESIPMEDPRYATVFLPKGQYTILATGDKVDPKTVKVEVNCEDKTINLDMRTVPQQPKHVFMGMTFTKLRPGSFWMGTDKEGREYLYERPRRKVSIKEPIFMQTTEVTEKNWQAVMGDNPADSGEPNQPIVEVSWDMARQFAERLSALDPDGTYRLPTEKEWEYACRANSDAEYCFGSSIHELKKYAWFAGNTESLYPEKVGSKRANRWGLFDMHGNVWEWVQDQFDFYEGAPKRAEYDSTLWKDMRVIRGGAWINDAEYLRCAQRSFTNAESTEKDIGFRLVFVPNPR